MRRRTYPIAVLSGTLAVLVALGRGGAGDAGSRPPAGRGADRPGTRPDQTNPLPVLRPGAVQTDPALTPLQTDPAPVLWPGAVQTDPV